MALRLLKAPKFSDEERRYVVDFLMALKKPLVVDFFKQEEITPAYGNKKDMRERLVQALDDGETNYPTIVDYIDRLLPWGKQHIYLYNSPGLRGKWGDEQWLVSRLAKCGAKKYYNARRRLILPDELTLSSVEHSSKRLTITAVQRQDYTERDKDRDYTEADDPDDADDQEVTAPGPGSEAGGLETVEYRAYVRHLNRGWVRFEWNLVSDLAVLQIGQLGRDWDYEEVKQSFFDLVEEWIDLSRFPVVDLRRAIARLHRRIDKGDREVQFVMADYKSVGGRRLAGHRPTGKNTDELFGSEAVIDGALSEIRRKGVGNKANVYWLPSDDYPNGGKNELEEPVHVHIIGGDCRMSLPIPQPEKAIRYVLHRVRFASK